MAVLKRSRSRKPRDEYLIHWSASFIAHARAALSVLALSVLALRTAKVRRCASEKSARPMSLLSQRKLGPREPAIPLPPEPRLLLSASVRPLK